MTPRQARDFVAACPECGWSGRPTTPRLAAYALRKHSCEKQRRLDARLARGQLRRAATDRTPRTCSHKRASHQHGTYAAYVLDFCRCLPCATANSTYEKQRTRQQAYGRWDGLVDAAPAREHVVALQAAGMGWKRVALASGVSNGALTKLLYGKQGRGPSRRIRPATANRLLAVTLAVADGVPVSGVGTRRRLQALVALGWSISSLGRQIGITNIHRTIHGHGDGLVKASTARAARDLYDRLWDTFPPEDEHRQKISASRARRYATGFQWPPPLAWDDDEIDDPYAVPDYGDQPDDDKEPTP